MRLDKVSQGEVPHGSNFVIKTLLVVQMDETCLRKAHGKDLAPGYNFKHVLDFFRVHVSVCLVTL